MSRQQATTERGARAAGENARQRIVAGLPVTERRLQLAGVSTAVLEGGNGPPIVLLQTEFAPVWMRVIPDPVTTHRVIAPDLPGLGASEVSDGPPDAKTVLTWLDELIERTCAIPPVLVGKGPAGALAARFAIDRSDRIDRLVLVDTYGLAQYRPPPRMALTFVGVMLRPTERGSNAASDATASPIWIGCAPRWVSATNGWRRNALDRFGTPSVKAAMRRLMTQLASAIPSRELDRIAVPTTLIWGRHDLGVRLNVAEAASARHGWPLDVIENARDDPAIEQPEAFLEALRTALDDSPNRMRGGDGWTAHAAQSMSRP
jgi:pimeloyl-ACP methyl ester carboxylesterase